MMKGKEKTGVEEVGGEKLMEEVGGGEINDTNKIGHKYLGFILLPTYLIFSRQYISHSVIHSYWIISFYSFFMLISSKNS